jgi:hypothetical protein
MRVNHTYGRGGALAYLAAYDVHAAQVSGRCEKTTGIDPFMSLVTQVMSQERYASAKRVFWVVDNVARWWDDHAVRDYASVTKLVQHPAAGPISFDIEIVYAPHEPDQRLVVYTTEPDSPTARVLPILASWNAAPHP